MVDHDLGGLPEGAILQTKEGRDPTNDETHHYRYYVYDQDRSHRYSLNLRDGEVYTRFYARQDVTSQNAVPQDKDGSYKADPAYGRGVAQRTGLNVTAEAAE